MTKAPGQNGQTQRECSRNLGPATGKACSQRTVLSLRFTIERQSKISLVRRTDDRYCGWAGFNVL